MASPDSPAGSAAFICSTAADSRGARQLSPGSIRLSWTLPTSPSFPAPALADHFAERREHRFVLLEPLRHILGSDPRVRV